MGSVTGRAAASEVRQRRGDGARRARHLAQRARGEGRRRPRDRQCDRDAVRDPRSLGQDRGAAGRIFHQAHLARERVPAGRSQSGRRARGGPVHAGHSLARAGSPIRSIRRRRFRRRRSTWPNSCDKFGNLGLAAAAYNAGETAVDKWLDDKGQLPFETQDYVLALTGHAAEEWRTPTPPELAGARGGPSCVSLIASLRTTPASRPSSRAGLRRGACRSPASFSRASAMRAFVPRARHNFYSIVGGKNPFVLGSVVRSRGFRPFYRVRLPAQNRPEAEKLCAALEAAGGACVVLRS